jgi:iron complex outermembrane recepter protein
MFSRISLTATTAATACVFILCLRWAASSAASEAADTPQSSENEITGLTEIVVTARKREENLQSVPITVNAFSSEALADTKVVNVTDLSDLVSNFQVLQGYIPNDPEFEMRGQFQSDSSVALEPSVGVYFDDVYIARAAGTLLNMQDLDRVEVLKGPQGTLYGKNTTGGAVKLVSKKPTKEFEASFSSAYETQAHRYIEQGMINVPLSDAWALRAVGTYTKTDQGYFTYFTQANPSASFPLDTGHDAGGRVALRFTPSEAFEMLLQADYSDSLTGGLPAGLVEYAPNSSATPSLGNLPVTSLEAGLESKPSTTPQFLAGNPLPAVTAGNAYLNAAAAQFNANPYRVGMTPNDVQPSAINIGGQVIGGSSVPKSRERVRGISDTFTWDLGGGLTLKSITAYRTLNLFSTDDIDGTDLYILDGFSFQSQKQVSQEFLLTGKWGERLDWSAGVLYFHESSDYRDLTRSLLVLSSLTGGAGSSTSGDVVSTSYAAYANGNYKLTDEWGATLGLRLTQDKKAISPTSTAYFTDGTSACAVEVNGVADCTDTKSVKFNNVSYSAGLNYEIAPGRMAYLSTASAYRAGGFNPRINTPASFSTFKPETDTNYELGLKADWLERRLRTNLALFYTDYKDIQTTVVEPGISFGNVVSVTVLQNSGQANVYGAEAEIAFRATQALTLGGNVGLLYSQLNSPVAADQGLSQLPNTPKFSGSAYGMLNFPLTANLHGFLRIDESYRGDAPSGLSLTDHNSTSPTYNDVIYRPYFRAYALLNANLKVVHQPSGLEFSVYGKNLTNKIYGTSLDGADGIGTFVESIGDPREVGVSVTAFFGAAKH